MRVTEETADRLVIELPPTLVRWIAALLGGAGALAVGTGIYALISEEGLARNPNIAVVGTFLLAVAGVLLWTAVTVVVTLDRPGNVARVVRRGPFAGSVCKEPLTAVTVAELESYIDSDGDRVSRVVLR